MIVSLYLIAIVAANLFAATFGPTASIFSAFAMIGASITLRDRLHDTWRGQGLPWRMALLIATGALLSWLISHNAGRIALASCIAFAVSETTDTIVYHILRRKPWLRRSNGSNIVAAAVDSLVFPTLAFGGFLWPIVLGQFIAKTFGGGLWSWVLSRRAAVVVGVLLFVAVALPAQKPPKFVIQAQVGTAHYPWNNYRPVGNVGLNALIFLPKRCSILLVGSRDVQKNAPWIGIAALQVRIWGK